MKTRFSRNGNCYRRLKDIVLHVGRNGKSTSTALFWVVTQEVLVISY